MGDERPTTHNEGLFVDRNMPADKYIVANLVVLMDNDGGFHCYMAQQKPMFGRPTAPMPSREVLDEITKLLAQAWSLASLTTTEEKE